MINDKEKQQNVTSDKPDSINVWRLCLKNSRWLFLFWSADRWMAAGLVLEKKEGREEVLVTWSKENQHDHDQWTADRAVTHLNAFSEIQQLWVSPATRRKKKTLSGILMWNSRKFWIWSDETGQNKCWFAARFAEGKKTNETPGPSC